MYRSHRHLIVLLPFVLFASLVGCTDDDDASGPPPTTAAVDVQEFTEEPDTPGLTVPPGFVPPDTRGVRLSKVPSEPRTAPRALGIFGGSASLRGVVGGPDGPIEGATILVERFVGSQTATTTLTAGTGGQWSVSGLLGGRYRIRAWLAPTFGAEEGQVVFLSAQRGSAEVNLELQRIEGKGLTAEFDRAEWSVGDELKVRAVVTDDVVGGDGLITGKPVGDVSVRIETSSNDVEVMTTNPVTSASNGGVAWTVTCRTIGTHEVRLRAGDTTVTVELPECTDADADKTEVVVPEFPVGTTFRVPYKDVLPAGSYITYNTGCETSFEVASSGHWTGNRQTVKGPRIVLKAPARDFKAVGESKPCEFQRSS